MTRSPRVRAPDGPSLGRGKQHLAGPHKWTDERIRLELATLLAGRSDWPAARDFDDSGRSVLRRVVASRGGPRYWASQMGVAYVRRPGLRPPAWPEHRIRRELQRVLSGRDTWPSATEFEQAGDAALWRAIKRAGGSERWELEFGVRRTSRRSGSRRVWTDARIEKELRHFLRGRQTWPAVSEFNHAGLASLFTAIDRYGGVEHWATLMGVERIIRRAGRRPGPYWTLERIGAELGRFCADRAAWPTQRDFAAARRMPLYWAASRTNGGLAGWAALLGFGEPGPAQQSKAA